MKTEWLLAGAQPQAPTPQVFGKFPTEPQQLEVVTVPPACSQGVIAVSVEAGVGLDAGTVPGCCTVGWGALSPSPPQPAANDAKHTTTQIAPILLRRCSMAGISAMKVPCGVAPGAAALTLRAGSSMTSPRPSAP